MASMASERSSRVVFGYHQHYHSANIRVSGDGRSARRIDPGNTYSGIAVSSVPLRGSCEFEVKLTGNDSCWEGNLVIGIVYIQKGQLINKSQFPDSASGCANCCVWGFNMISKKENGQELIDQSYHHNLDHLRKGDTVGLQITKEGTLSFFFNGSYKGEAVTGVYARSNMEMYAVVDHFGKATSTQIVKAVLDNDSEVVGLRGQLEELKSEVAFYKLLYEQKCQELLLTKQDNNRLAMERVQIEETASGYANSWKTTHKDITTTPIELGRGGWGLITVGFFREQKVAVKQLYKIIMSESTLAVMHREINTMSKIRHPKLLLFIGAALDHPSGNPLIITEIMDTSLRQAYEKNQIKQKNTKLSILRDTAAGLNYLHCHPDEIIHRDVSSANVLLESRGPNKWRAKLSDFGSANIARNAFSEAPGAAIYRAPELNVTVATYTTRRPQQTTKMDVFSYGVLMCEVMTCRFPEMDRFRDTLQSISDSSPPIGNIIRLCIKLRPKDRPTMKEVINQIDADSSVYKK